MKKISILIVIGVFLLAGCGTKEENPVIENGTDNVVTATGFVQTLASEKFEEAYQDFAYDEKMKKAVSPAIYKDIWDALLEQQGKFVKIQGYKETISGDYKIVSVHSQFEKATINLNVVFTEGHAIAGFNFTPYTEASGENSSGIREDLEEIKVKIVTGKYEMDGMITLPKEEGDFPVVLLVAGSGPSDMDETIYENKPFRDIAWGLAEKGIASLRYDKRTKDYGLEMSKLELTVKDEYLEDIQSAYQLLLHQENIHPEKIYILGHSQGGNLIPRIAQITEGAAGYIMAAANASSIEDLMIKQYHYIFSLDGKLDNQEKEQIAFVEKAAEKIRTLDEKSDYTTEELLGVPKAYWIDLRENNAYNLAEKLEKPVFVIQGDKDYQVTLDEFELWEKAFQGMDNVNFKVYQGLNHLFMKSLGKPSPEEYQTQQEVDKEVIDDIAEFILSR